MQHAEAQIRRKRWNKLYVMLQCRHCWSVNSKLQITAQQAGQAEQAELQLLKL